MVIIIITSMLVTVIVFFVLLGGYGIEAPIRSVSIKFIAIKFYFFIYFNVLILKKIYIYFISLPLLLSFDINDQCNSSTLADL
jgi:hypothetical protein